MTDLVKPAPVRPAASKTRRLVVAASIGNALEFYEIVVYGYFAVVIAKQFFPADSDTASLLLTYGTFGLSFLLRPIGAIVLGGYADKAGRKAALLVSIALMMAGTSMIAFMPNYATIGVAAPIGMMIARLLQGFAVAGEFGSSTAFLAEHDDARKGFLGAWQFSSQGIASFVAALFGFVLTSMLTPAQLGSWGWRVPFLFGLLVGPIGLYVRSHLDETPAFLKSGGARTPVADMFRTQKLPLILSICAISMSTACNYMLVYMPTYAAKELGLPPSVGFAASLVAAIVLTVVAPLTGQWSDGGKRARMMIAFAAIGFVTVLPAFWLLVAYKSAFALMLALGWLAILKATYAGPLPAFLAEMFPTATRGTGMALSYNTGVTIFGGSAPFVATWLIQDTGTNLAPAFYVMAIAALSIGALMIAKTRPGVT